MRNVSSDLGERTTFVESPVVYLAERPTAVRRRRRLASACRWRTPYAFRSLAPNQEETECPISNPFAMP